MGEYERLEARLDDVIELRLARAAPAGGPGGAEIRAAGWRSCRRNLAANEIALCYHIGTERVIAWLLTARSLRTYALPVTPERLAELVDQATLPLPRGPPRRRALSRPPSASLPPRC